MLSINESPRRLVTVISRASFLGMALSLCALSAPAAQAQHGGAVFMQNNDPAANSILVFRRAVNGTLTHTGTVATGGRGAGGGLANQGSVLLSPDKNWLFTTNAGSNDISAFAITPFGLQLTDRISSHGVRPVSLTLNGNLLYVLNSGGVNNITGFRVSERGKLRPIRFSSRMLSPDSTAPAQVSFNPGGDLLIVSERTSNRISTYTVDDEGLAQGPIVNLSQGATPFGFAFGKRGLVIVSEAAGGAAGASSVSSYGIKPDGSLEAVSSSVATGQSAACWLAVTGNGRYAYTANTGSSTLSGYLVRTDGTLVLLNANGVAARLPAGSGPTDMAMSGDSRYLYAIGRARGEINVFRIESDGSLSPRMVVTGLPISINGLAAE